MLKLIVVWVHNSVKMLKATKWYTLNGLIVCYEKYISKLNV